MRKCVFGSTGRFSRDLDFDAFEQNGFEADIERAILENDPYFGIQFTIEDLRYSMDGNFGSIVGYEHSVGSGRFELQISYRVARILESYPLSLQPQLYFPWIECAIPSLAGLDPYEMIGEKVIACNRRLGGSAKDIYDLFLWAQRPFTEQLVRRLAVLKCWTDRRREHVFEPSAFLEALVSSNFRWEDLRGLVPRRLQSDRGRICQAVQRRFDFLLECSGDEQVLLGDQVAHREELMFQRLRDEARTWAAEAVR